MGKSIIIIGGGLTGLAAGCYGRMNGYTTTIFEMHDKAGGVCTAWKRQGYSIDGAMNWLVGTNPKSGFYHFWEEMGAAKDWKIYNHEFFSIIEDREGRSFKFYCDADQFERYMLEIAPEDKEAIQDFTEAIRTFSHHELPMEKPVELYEASDYEKMAKMQPFMELQQKWSGVTCADFAKRLKNPFIREVFSHLGGMPMFMYLWVLSLQHSKSAGYVLGGAPALVKPIEKRYKELGGDIFYKSKVVKILVENDTAVGVKVEDGTEHRADWIISAGDGHTVIFDMLGGKYVDETIKKMYDQPNIFAPLLYTALGVRRSLHDALPSIGGLKFSLVKPITIAGKEENSMNVLVYTFDPSLAPAGKNVLIVSYGTDYDYWKKLRENPEAYKKEKERICNDIIAGLEQRFPGISTQVEMRDVATPISWERYTGNWRGAYEGWMFGAHASISKTLPGLSNFYLAGQWVNAGGGMPTAVMSGNHTIQMLCKQDNKKFVVAKP
jgi:phytoene dehydrogenase-like protein